MRPTRTPLLALLLLCALLLATPACLGDDDDAGDDDTGRATSTSPRATATARRAAATTTAPEVTATTAATNTPARATMTPGPLPTARPSTPATGTPPTGNGDNAAVEEELQEVEDTIAEVRELELKEDVLAEILSRDQLRENMMTMLEEDYPRADAEQDTRIMWLLRLVDDPDLDLYQLYVDLYSERVLGYYDPEANELFLISEQEDGLSGLAEMTMAHELTHALQDQYYDLEVLRPEDMPADAALAITALIEGDAETAGTLYALNHMDPDELMDAILESATISSEVVDAAPAYIREGLYFPYQQGAEFVSALYEQGGFAAVDEVYANPPVSTEQVLHPEKYFDRDDPTDVSLPDLTAALGSGWALTDEDTLGEFDFQLLFRENGVGNAEEAAAGWDGARYYLYENGPAALVAFTTTWDSEADADEALAAWEEILPGLTLGSVHDDGQGRYTIVTSAGASITVVTGSDRAAVEAAAAALDS